MNGHALVMFLLISIGVLGCLFIIHKDWKRYGLLYLIAAISGNLLCYMFTVIGFYSFPENVLHGEARTPFALVSVIFPFLVLFGVRYSPESWKWKISFYMGIVHLGVLGEVILKSTIIFRFGQEWDLWDSYTLWWIYYLLFEVVGGKIIPANLRKPISSNSFRTGNWTWMVLHVIFVVTIFLGGVYVGWALF